MLKYIKNPSSCGFLRLHGPHVAPGARDGRDARSDAANDAPRGRKDVERMVNECGLDTVVFSMKILLIYMVNKCFCKHAEITLFFKGTYVFYG